MQKKMLDLSNFEHLPELIVFDLDYTLWPLWIDTHLDGPPFQLMPETNTIKDRSGGTLKLYPQVGHIIHLLKECSVKNIKLAIASRTSAIEWAYTILNSLPVPHYNPSTQPQPPPKLHNFFDVFEIYPSSKIAHFKSIQSKTGIRFHDMLFFDDESRNIKEVGRLGVTCFHVSRDGVNFQSVHEGLKLFQDQKKSRGLMKKWLSSNKSG